MESQSTCRRLACLPGCFVLLAACHFSFLALTIDSFLLLLSLLHSFFFFVFLFVFAGSGCLLCITVSLLLFFLACLLSCVSCVLLSRAALSDSALKRKNVSSQREKKFWEARKKTKKSKIPFGADQKFFKSGKIFSDARKIHVAEAGKIPAEANKILRKREIKGPDNPTCEVLRRSA